MGPNPAGPCIFKKMKGLFLSLRAAATILALTARGAIKGERDPPEAFPVGSLGRSHPAGARLRDPNPVDHRSSPRPLRYGLTVHDCPRPVRPSGQGVQRGPGRRTSPGAGCELPRAVRYGHDLAAGVALC